MNESSRLMDEIEEVLLGSRECLLRFTRSQDPFSASFDIEWMCGDFPYVVAKVLCLVGEVGILSGDQALIARAGNIVSEWIEPLRQKTLGALKTHNAIFNSSHELLRTCSEQGSSFSQSAFSTFAEKLGMLSKDLMQRAEDINTAIPKLALKLDELIRDSLKTCSRVRALHEK